MAFVRVVRRRPSPAFFRKVFMSLEVESFSAMPEGDERGTVAGYATALATCDDPTCEDTCDGDTRFDSCQGTCVECRTHFRPNCPTQKPTGPCGC